MKSIVRIALLVLLVVLLLAGFLVYRYRDRLSSWIDTHLPRQAKHLLTTEQAPSPEPSATAVSRATPVLSSTNTPWRLHLPLVQQDTTETPRPSKVPEPTDTPRPSATPTPVLPWPEPLDEPPKSKLGLHVQWNNSPEIMSFARRMKPRVVKAVGDFGFCAELKRESPSTIIVGRIETDQSLEGDPQQAAHAFVSQHLATYQLNPSVDYWEGINEPGIKGKMDWYAAFEAERARTMAELGFKTAVGSFSAGVPEYEEFEQFLPAIEAAKQHGGILTLHEYDAPTFDRAMGAGLPGYPNYPDRGALALRYRWWYEELLKPRDLVIPLVISEAGVDGLIGNRPGPKGHGWKDFSDYWAQQGLGGNPYLVYIDQLRWYDDQLRQDDYVIGWALFTVGAMNDDWESYDVTDMLRHIAHYIMVPSA